MDQVLIEGLSLETVIGVYDWERTVRQRLELDLELGTDIRPAARDDNLDRTLDYAAICQRLADYADANAHGLVETFAERVAALLIEEFGVRQLRLTVRKPGAVAAARAVGIRIERSAD
ncbi:dihydroneopterin aldolase [Salinicola sp. MIT1003]|uniref:dihydroneopterin aldolase n=1 Tax=Salinicola sp. MIT1003 TaxID=1882734 RepID=UPI0008DC727A|nr:dihydroneopterin aldolase [Salinicola sp. MIT1003]OHZ01724.1 dihydroneopterin aldolase [Salinicola sp. MIT1003]